MSVRSSLLFLSIFSGVCLIFAIIPNSAVNHLRYYIWKTMYRNYSTALPISHNNEDSLRFIARGAHNGHDTVCFYDLALENVRHVYRGVHYSTTRDKVKILSTTVPRNFEWIPANSTEVPRLSNTRSLVSAGNDTGFPLYVGRSYIPGFGYMIGPITSFYTHSVFEHLNGYSKRVFVKTRNFDILAFNE